MINLYEELIKHNSKSEKLMTVTSWASSDDKANLDEIRWVMVGKKNYLNFIGTGLIAPIYNKETEQLEMRKCKYDNCITREVELSNIKKPNDGLKDGILKRIFRQRIYIPKK